MEDIDLTIFDDPKMIYPNAPLLEPAVLIPAVQDRNRQPIMSNKYRYKFPRIAH